MRVNLHSNIHELTVAELDDVSGGADVGFNAVGNGVSFSLPGLLHLAVTTDGDNIYLTGTVGRGHGGSVVLTPPGK